MGSLFSLLSAFLKLKKRVWSGFLVYFPLTKTNGLLSGKLIQNRSEELTFLSRENWNIETFKKYNKRKEKEETTCQVFCMHEHLSVVFLSPGRYNWLTTISFFFPFFFFIRHRFLFFDTGAGEWLLIVHSYKRIEIHRVYPFTKNSVQRETIFLLVFFFSSFLRNSLEGIYVRKRRKWVTHKIAYMCI